MDAVNGAMRTATIAGVAGALAAGGPTLGVGAPVGALAGGVVGGLAGLVVAWFSD
jgi:hypothetical protein